MTSPVAAPLPHRAKSSRQHSPAPVKPTHADELHSPEESSELSESSEDPSDLSSSDNEGDDNNSNSNNNSNKDDASSHMAVHASKEPEVVNLRAHRGKKPTYKLDEEELGPDIRTFLKDFLPKLKAANEELEADRKRGTLKKREIDAVDGDTNEQYIEMNLGLGVLKVKDTDTSSESSSDTDMSDGHDSQEEEDVLGKLMGQEKSKEPAGIQEVGGKQGP